MGCTNTWKGKHAGTKGQKTTCPTHRTGGKGMDNSKGKGNAGKGKQGKGGGQNNQWAQPQWTNTWTCPNPKCVIANPGGCRMPMWKPACHCCYLLWAAQDAIRQHLVEELRAETAAGKAASKGKAKDKQGQGKGKGKGKGNATAEELNEEQQEQPMPMQVDTETTTTKHLLTMGLHPAPMLSELKKYPRPVLKTDTPAEDQAAAKAITKMEEAI